MSGVGAPSERGRGASSHGFDSMQRTAIMVASIVGACLVLAVAGTRLMSRSAERPASSEANPSLPTEKVVQEGPAAVAEETPVNEEPVSIAPPSGVAEADGIVRVSVYIDVLAERIRLPEATAMLRTKAWLRKTYPELPKDFNVNGRIVENEFDDDERVYSYVSEYDKAAILEAVERGKKADGAGE